MAKNILKRCLGPVLTSSVASFALTSRSSILLRPQRVQVHQMASFTPSLDGIVTESEAAQVLLPLEEGSHRSLKINVPSEVSQDDCFDTEDIGDTMEATIAACRAMGKSSLWVYVPMSRASFIEKADLRESGFSFHHAKDDTAVLNLWLRDDVDSKIPLFATHNVGVGALVVNSRDEVLCVRELRTNYRPWKTPTGLADIGENIDAAAEREVLEETGIRTKFHSVIGFRQTHGLAHGNSDLFFVCRLDPIEEQDAEGIPVIPEPVAQECEIENASWVPMSEYRAMCMGSDDQPGHPMMATVLASYEKGMRIDKQVIESVVPGRKANDMYYPESSSTTDITK